MAALGVLGALIVVLWWQLGCCGDVGDGRGDLVGLANGWRDGRESDALAGVAVDQASVQRLKYHR